jgi:hypothetical protein
MARSLTKTHSYNDGTWLPTISSTTNCTVNSVNFGDYVKVGKLVTCGLQVTVTDTAAWEFAFLPSDLPYALKAGTSVIGGGCRIGSSTTGTTRAHVRSADGGVYAYGEPAGSNRVWHFVFSYMTE